MAKLRKEMEEVYFPTLAFLHVPSEIQYRAGWRAALRDYGDYEIVEGELQVWDDIGGKRRYVCVGGHALGDDGDHIKLLVPPREKEKCDQPQPGEREKRLEEALARITDKLLEGWDPLEGDAMYWSGLCRKAFNIARRALKEEE